MGFTLVAKAGVAVDWLVLIGFERYLALFAAIGTCGFVHGLLPSAGIGSSLPVRAWFAFGGAKAATAVDWLAAGRDKGNLAWVTAFIASGLVHFGHMMLSYGYIEYYYTS
jgi:hypothetical protein